MHPGYLKQFWGVAFELGWVRKANLPVLGMAEWGSRVSRYDLVPSSWVWTQGLWFLGLWLEPGLRSLVL